jgi:hypothetical protein
LEEIWKDIEGYEGLYQVSNLGRVNNVVRNKIKTLSLHTKTGYFFVHLYKDNTEKNKSVHRLVAETFISNNDKKLCVNHKNSNRLDNTVQNLEYCTHSENTQHAYDNGRCKSGELHNMSKLSDKAVVEIRELRGKKTQKEIAQLFGVSRPNISLIQTFKTRKTHQK